MAYEQLSKEQTHALVVQKRNMIAGCVGRFTQLLDGDKVRAERAVQVYFNMLSKNSRLAECTDTSLGMAFMAATEFQLDPTLGECAIIPYGKEAQFQIQYQGLINLAHRSGRVKVIYAEARHEKDPFKIRFGTKKSLMHEPAEGERGGVMGYYAVVQVRGADASFEYWNIEQCIEWGRKYSKSFRSQLTDRGKLKASVIEILEDVNKYMQTWAGPKRGESAWYTATGSMCKKTMIIQVLKLCPKSVEDKGLLLLAEAVNRDQDSVYAETLEKNVKAHVKTLGDLTARLEAEQQTETPQRPGQDSETPPDDGGPSFDPAFEVVDDQTGEITNQDPPFDPIPVKTDTKQQPQPQGLKDRLIAKLEALIVAKQPSEVALDGIFTEIGCSHEITKLVVSDLNKVIAELDKLPCLKRPLTESYRTCDATNARRR